MMRSLPHLHCLFSTPVVKRQSLEGSQKPEGVVVRAGEAKTVCLKHVCERDCIRENRKKEWQRVGGGDAKDVSLQSQKRFHTLALVYLIKYLLNNRINVIGKRSRVRVEPSVLIFPHLSVIFNIPP